MKRNQKRHHVNCINNNNNSNANISRRNSNSSN